MTEELVLRCPRHPTYTGEGLPPPMASHTQHCAACTRLHEIVECRQRAQKTDNWLEASILRAKAETLSWPQWKRDLLQTEVKGQGDRG